MSAKHQLRQETVSDFLRENIGIGLSSSYYPTIKDEITATNSIKLEKTITTIREKHHTRKPGQKVN